MDVGAPQPWPGSSIPASYPQEVFALDLAVVALAAFVVGMIHDTRSFSNAVFLGLALAFGALSLAERLAETPERSARLLLLALVLLVAAGPFVAAIYLVANGIMMVRREGARPVNLLSLLAGFAILTVLGLDFTADRAGSEKLSLFASATVLLCGYVSFLFVSYVIYAFIYSRLGVYRGADFVVVLGSGLKDGGRVPPLLASRLERARTVYETLVPGGAAGPVLIVSGGKGSDERVSEAEAMAGYLIERGFPAGRVVREDRSRTTEENIRFSKAIMDRSRPASRCVIVTSSYHAFRAAIIARRAGVNGQVTGAPTAAYYWPSAVLREFAAVFLRYKLVNFGIFALIVVLPLAYDAVRGAI
jgi:uncharacterized SAM-binding protein YcdF (DUF218 family)